MSSNRLIYDRCAYATEIKESTEPLEYNLFLGKFENVIKVKYTGEILYNVLMEEYSQMCVNNLICETLHPNNIIAKLYTKKCKYTNETRDKIVVLLTKCIQKKDYKTYNKIVQRC